MNKVVESYTLVEKVGSGQYGNVYRAAHRRSGEEFAVKVMNAAKFRHTPKLTEFTNNEIAALSKIEHKNIIRFVEMLRTSHNYYLVYEYCNGGNLAELIRSQGPLPQPQAVAYFQQLRQAYRVLNHAHILHRDLKPGNILFHDGVVKLADFGFCKELGREKEMTATMVGSPLYMSPEILKGLPYDARADVWSLGVIFYEMLFGVCPFEQSSIAALTNLIDSSPLTFPPDSAVSPHLKTLLTRMLDVRLGSRMTPAELFEYPLESVDLQPTMRAVVSYIRRSLFFLAQTLDLLSDGLNDLLFLRVTFQVYKILTAIQKASARDSFYWRNLKLAVQEQKWEMLNRRETTTLLPFAQILREALGKADDSPKTAEQLGSEEVDAHYFLELAVQVEGPMRDRLLECLLFLRHFRLVGAGHPADLTDYSGEGSGREKQRLCLGFLRLYH